MYITLEQVFVLEINLRFLIGSHALSGSLKVEQMGGKMLRQNLMRVIARLSGFWFGNVSRLDRSWYLLLLIMTVFDGCGRSTPNGCLVLLDVLAIRSFNVVGLGVGHRPVCILSLWSFSMWVPSLSVCW